MGDWWLVDCDGTEKGLCKLGLLSLLKVQSASSQSCGRDDGLPQCRQGNLFSGYGRIHNVSTFAGESRAFAEALDLTSRTQRAQCEVSVFAVCNATKT